MIHFFNAIGWGCLSMLSGVVLVGWPCAMIVILFGEHLQDVFGSDYKRSLLRSFTGGLVAAFLGGFLINL